MTDNLVPSLEKGEIPSEVIEELEQNFSAVDWKYYNVDREELGEDFMQMISRKASYTKELDDYGPKPCIDPETLEATTKMANTIVSYIVRAKWDVKNSTAYVWMVKACPPLTEQGDS